MSPKYLLIVMDEFEFHSALSWLTKSSFFNTTSVSEAEFNEYLNRKFIDENEKGLKTEVVIYIIIIIIFNIVFVPSLILFYYLRNSYIIRQRNFLLTFVGGIAAYINAFIGFIPQIMLVPCPLPVYSVNVLNALVNLIFFTRSLRVILFYHFNIFKVSSIKKKALNRISYKEREPNSYLPKIFNKIKIINIAFISIPITISLVVTVYQHIKYYSTCRFNQFDDTLIGLKNNTNEELFLVTPILGRFYTLFSIILTIALFFVKDANNYGVKFECLSSSIMLFLFSLINTFLQIKATQSKGTNTTSPVSSKQYFYKVLNSQSLLNELRTIAIQEFSVENVLFWENYKVLQKMVYCYQIQYKKAKSSGNEGMISQYDFEGYYIQQIQSNISNSTFSMDSNAYDPDMPLPKEIFPFYNSFYQTYIDYNSPAAVNISGSVIRHIQNEMCTYPTVSMFDEAKNEVVEMMYNSIFPILLKKNRKELHNAIL
ncbi:hypothetical protein H8356DRAFT_929701 [Neocallimastix lanati (nom. inval.)]|uniref:RGS domain-containing protein n=1 Tax=Neocallimastix californiae TaxID=1754190 RepID=A0A1Y2B1N0_9FUNG|nr:hypothetical protein H8356DRAFT_929701 [Neocallimastix sp. JGI-2020a]ORY27975.1 hypothetical protein LY90DRAFT_513285 [Neocallimastix californiae]|eukprot:ORY27975.1 hypothetical protein LY90DRAFT_513285 [Neocallimastix californiae]